MTRIFTPTQLSLYSNSKIAAWWEELEQRGLFEDKLPKSTALEIRLQEEGDKHEKQLLEFFIQKGKSVANIQEQVEGNQKLRITKTVECMKKGFDVIYQASFKNLEMRGIADFLYKVPLKSDLGDWSYQPIECKLSSKTKTTFLIQSCCYCDLLKDIQGIKPKNFRLYLGGGKRFANNDFQLSNYWSWYKKLKSNYKFFIDEFSSEEEPDLSPGKHGKWNSFIEETLKKKKDLSLVAGMNKFTREILIKNHINTIDDFASTKNISNIVKEGDPKVIINLQKQAQAQLKPKNKNNTPYYEWKKIDLKKKPKPLPEPNVGDLWFDMESINNPITGKKLEYLFGVSFRDEEGNIFDQEGEINFKSWWAHDKTIQEPKAFEDWVNWVEERRSKEKYKDLHIYHYGHYEIAAMRQLKQEHNICEDIIDEWLSSGILVDLYPIVKGAMYLGEEGYSIKNVEKIYPEKYDFKREGDVANAVDSIVEYQIWKDSGESEDVSKSKKLKKIEDYNKKDCFSTYVLHNFLLDEKENDPSININVGRKIIEKTEKKKDELSIISNNFLEKIKYLKGRKIEKDELKQIKTFLDIDLQSHMTLSHLLKFHKKESNILWWAYFDRKNANSISELKDDPEVIINSNFKSKEYLKSAKTGAYFHKYIFKKLKEPTLQTEFNKRGRLTMEVFESELRLEVTALDIENGEIILKYPDSKNKKWQQEKKEELEKKYKIELEKILEKESIDLTGLPETCTFFRVPDDPSLSLRKNLQKQAEDWLKDPKAIPNSLKNLLSKKGDDKIVKLNNLIESPGVDIATSIADFFKSNHSQILGIQGPPGTGKSTITANCVSKLASYGFKIAISSNSHSVINNLLKKIQKILSNQENEVKIFKSENRKEPNEELEKKSINTIQTKKVADVISDGCIIGGTVWALCLEELKDRFDLLVIDEAGQMSLANLMIMSGCAKSILLVGDQQQLSHVSEALHDSDAGLSSLEYWLSMKKVIPNNLGVFLNKSWRMHPRITSIVSDLFYEGKLKGYENNEVNKIYWRENFISEKKKQIPENGVHFEVIKHKNNSQESEEETEVIAKIIDKLHGSKFEYFSDGKLEKGIIKSEEIIIIAPYNRQVQRLRKKLGKKAEISTVDKFQGREAAVAIFSLTSSTGNDAPRGLNFLLEPNRLNVAISRAKCLSIIVGSEDLLSSSVNSIEDAKLLNNICMINSQNEKNLLM